MCVNEHFEPIYNAVSCQLRGFTTASDSVDPHKVTTQATVLLDQIVQIQTPSTQDTPGLKLDHTCSFARMEDDQNPR